MTIQILPNPDPIASEVLDAISKIDVATFGHFLEVGFVDPALRSLAGGNKFIGRAVTVKTAPRDSTLIHYAVSRLQPGDVLVIDTSGNTTHAALGGFVMSAIATAGAVAVVLDGVCTDIADLRDSGVNVYARATAVLTNKLLGIPEGGINVPISCGGVTVTPGDIVIGDENGVLIRPARELLEVLQAAQASDATEPGQIQQIRKGLPLYEISPAAEILKNLGVDVD